MFIDSSTRKVFRWLEHINNNDHSTTERIMWIVMFGCVVTTDIDGLFINEDNSIWIKPICSTDWQQEYIDVMLDRLIEYYMVVYEINPNRIYLLGISVVGGDGVYQLAPRMADRLAAAGTFDGNPYDASPLSLQNLPFAIFMNKNKNENNKSAAYAWAQKLEMLAKEHIHSGYPYWIKIGNYQIQRQSILYWLHKHERNPWPMRIVWHYHVQNKQKRFYWISLPFLERIQCRQTLIVEARHKNKIYLEQIPPDIIAFIIRLSDALVNLDQPITIYINQDNVLKIVFEGIVPRTHTAIDQSIAERPDPMSVSTALVHVVWNTNPTLINCHSSIDTNPTCPICFHGAN